MTLWNLIRDFFVQNLFGGYDSTGTLFGGNTLGFAFYDNVNQNLELLDNTDYFVNVGNSGASFSTDWMGNVYLTLGDYLSTTLTIVTLLLLVFFLYIFVKWLFKVFAGLLH